jgi:hypothetical protein
MAGMGIERLRRRGARLDLINAACRCSPHHQAWHLSLDPPDIERAKFFAREHVIAPDAD